MTPKIMAVAGARGGVGASVLVANLAVYLATVGRKVIVLDADPMGGDAHAALGMLPPQAAGKTFASFADPISSSLPVEAAGLPDGCRQLVSSLADIRPAAPTDVTVLEDGLVLRSASTQGLGLVQMPPGARLRPEQLRRWLPQWNADYVIVDLGSSSASASVSMFLEADLRWFVTSPEPSAVEGSYRFLRRAFFWFVKGRLEEAATSALGAASGRGAQAVVEDFQQVMGTMAEPYPLEVLEALVLRRSEAVLPYWQALNDFRFPFVVNQVRARTDLELGEIMMIAGRARTRLRMQYVGYVDHDDAVWLSLRRGKPLLVETPGSKAGRCIERLARKVLASAQRPMGTVLPDVAPPGTHHEVLGVSRSASEDDVRRAYKSMRYIFSEESLGLRGLFSPQAAAQVQARIRVAHDVLVDAARRKPYELSVFPNQELQAYGEAEGEEMPASLPPAPVITPDTEFSGKLLRTLRESQGMRLSDISRTTKVNMKYLHAIEDEDFAALPADVYVRGFVGEYAKCLRLEPEFVARSFLQRRDAHA